ncbi:hypothetical protein CDAR_622181 [Caerostris darwini]|uniref:Uncharacterized protein n=1 Tax=Caerostris darwini TaxID=1538125 RepID=A0AAV4QDE1_9ARAC|nr:hypothetical protein CDAR_622181 [Caerostris darwini]
MSEEKVENFVKYLFYDLYSSYIFSNELDVSVSMQDEEDEDEDVQAFFSIILDFFSEYEDGIFASLYKAPVLLFSSEAFFTEFVYSVCCRLRNEQPFYPLFGISAFLLNVATLSMHNECYRLVLLLPEMFLKVFNDMLKKQFFISGGFENLSAISQYLKDDHTLRNITIRELNELIEKAISGEINFQEKKILGKSYVTVGKVFKEDLLTLEFHRNRKCSYCKSYCFVNLRVFFQPSIKYKPGKNSY